MPEPGGQDWYPTRWHRWPRGSTAPVCPPRSRSVVPRAAIPSPCWRRCSGLRCRRLGIPIACAKSSRPPTAYRGQLLKTFVSQEPRRQASGHDVPLSCLHFRDKDGMEVYIAIERGARMVAGGRRGDQGPGNGDRIGLPEAVYAQRRGRRPVGWGRGTVRRRDTCALCAVLLRRIGKRACVSEWRIVQPAAGGRDPCYRPGPATPGNAVGGTGLPSCRAWVPGQRTNLLHGSPPVFTTGAQPGGQCRRYRPSLDCDSLAKGPGRDSTIRSLPQGRGKRHRPPLQGQGWLSRGTCLAGKGRASAWSTGDLRWRL